MRGSVLLLLALSACSRATDTVRPPVSSVLLVTIDTLRADRVGCYGDRQARTPNMDALAREGMLFEAAYSPAPLTLPAHTTIMTGLLPPVHGVRGNGSFVLGPGSVTLAEALRGRGLATGAFIGGFPLARRFGLDRGFDHYDDDLKKASGVSYDFAERRADQVVNAARAWLAGKPGRVFLWVHLFDPHAPYDPPDPFRGDDPYRGEIAAADAALGALLAAWDARPGPSVVALTADHGEAFGEHGEESHSLFVYDTTLRVPLILRGHGLPNGRRVAAPVGLSDLGATLLALLPEGGQALPGRSLTAHVSASPPPGPLYAETLAPRFEFGWSDLRSLRDGRYKYIRAPQPELYDTTADPGEAHDLAAQEPKAARRMADALEAALRGMGESESRRTPDAESRERLGALGYVQGPEGRGSGADPKDRVEVALRIARAAGPFPDFAAAVKVYQELVALDPPNPLVNFRLADALLRAGRGAEAVPYFKRVVASGPRTAEPFVGLATAYANGGRLADAQAVLEGALKLEPRNGQVHYNLGEIARLRGDQPAARASYRAALDDPVTRERAQARLEALR